MSAEIIDLDPAQADRRRLVNDIRNAATAELGMLMLFHFEERTRYAGISAGIQQASEIYAPRDPDNAPPTAA